jgi:hypothetical protein
MSVPVQTMPTLTIGTPRPLFTFERPNAQQSPAFDTLDGRRFVVVRPLKLPESRVVVVERWFEEFRSR